MLKPSVAVACVVLVGGAIGGCEGISDKDIEFATLKDVRSLRDSAAKDPKAMLLIDARAPRHFVAGHIPGAVNYQLPEFDERSSRRATIEAYDELIVYGDNPGTPESKGLTKRLMELGYSDVRLFAGGLMEWKDAGLPVEQSESAPPAPAR